MVEKIDPSAKNALPPLTPPSEIDSTAPSQSPSPKGVSQVPDTLEMKESEEENAENTKSPQKSTPASVFGYFKQLYDKVFPPSSQNEQIPGIENPFSEEKDPGLSLPLQEHPLEEGFLENLIDSPGAKISQKPQSIFEKVLPFSFTPSAEKDIKQEHAVSTNGINPLQKPGTDSPSSLFSTLSLSPKQQNVLHMLFGDFGTEKGSIFATKTLLESIAARIVKEGIHPLQIVSYLLMDPTKKSLQTILSQRDNPSQGSTSHADVAKRTLLLSLEKSKTEETLLPYLKEFAETFRLDYTKLEVFTKTSQWQEFMNHLLVHQEPVNSGKEAHAKMNAVTLSAVISALASPTMQLVQPSVIVTALPINPPFIFNAKGKKKSSEKEKTKDSEKDSSEDDLDEK